MDGMLAAQRHGLDELERVEEFLREERWPEDELPGHALGWLVKALRGRTSRRNFAGQLGIRPRVLMRLETQQTATPSQATWQQIAAVLQVDHQELERICRTLAVIHWAERQWLVSTFTPFLSQLHLGAKRQR